MNGERFDELVLMHFDDCLGEGDERELARALASSPEARARFRQLSRLEGGTAHVARAGVLPSSRVPAARARARRRPTLWLGRLMAAAIVAVAVGLGALALAHRPPVPCALVATLGGEARLHRAGATLPLSVGMALRAGDEIEAIAPVGLRWQDEATTMEVRAGATVRLAALVAPERVDLVAGELEAQVAPQPHESPMIFACGGAEAEVLGTRLTLARDSARTRLGVIEGRVRLRNAAGSVEVVGGAVAEAVAASAPELVPVADGNGVVHVSTTRMLARAVAEAQSGRTIELAPGIYAIAAPLSPPAGVKQVVLRGGGDSPRAVRLDGGGTARYLIELAQVSAVTVANLSLEGAAEHLVLIHGDLGCDDLVFSRLRFGASGSNALRMVCATGPGASHGTVIDCEFDNAGTMPDPTFLAYVDLVAARGWRIAHCRFHPMRLSDPAAFPSASAILLEGGGGDNVAEGNRICGCHRGITWGVGDNGPGREQSGGRIVDNMISRRAGEAGDAGISVNGSPDVLVAHNTVLLRGTYQDAIEYRWPSAAREVIIDNCCDAAIDARDGATARLDANLATADPAWFIDADANDLRPKAPAPPALLAGVAVPGVTVDIDGAPFGASPAIGAFQTR